MLILIIPTWSSSKFNARTDISGLFSSLNGTLMFSTLGSVFAIRAESYQDFTITFQLHGSGPAKYGSGLSCRVAKTFLNKSVQKSVHFQKKSVQSVQFKKKIRTIRTILGLQKKIRTIRTFWPPWTWQSGFIFHNSQQNNLQLNQAHILLLCRQYYTYWFYLLCLSLRCLTRFSGAFPPENQERFFRKPEFFRHNFGTTFRKFSGYRKKIVLEIVP